MLMQDGFVLQRHCGNYLNYKLYPSVERLQIHLPNHHQVWFYKYQRVTDVLNDNQNVVIMLTEFFAPNQMDPHARNYLYREIP